MPTAVFADSFYWIALARPRDQWHDRAAAWAAANSQTPIVTTDEVLAEFLNSLCRGGESGRLLAVGVTADVRREPHVSVLPQSRTTFDEALAFYESRPDKEYSLTDCRSMLAMRSQGITHVLTNDHHFTQEGFTILFP
jgi:predicted nucleic acid-binding protein